MTIHHDKLAYGKLKSLNEQLSDDDLKAMLDELNGDDCESCATEYDKISKKDEKEDE